MGFGMGYGKGSMTCRHQTVLAFGIIQVMAGAVILGAGIYLLTQGSLVSRAYYHGIWGGASFLLTGALGMIGGARHVRGCEIAFMILSILLAGGTWLALILLSLAGIVLDASYTSVKVYDGWDKAKQIQCQLDSEAARYHFNSLGIAGTLESLLDYKHPCLNTGAVQANMAILGTAVALPLLLILSASFACCAVCRCCGARQDDEITPA